MSKYWVEINRENDIFICLIKYTVSSSPIKIIQYRILRLLTVDSLELNMNISETDEENSNNRVDGLESK